MAEWFNELTLFERTYWIIAVPSSLVFLIILVTTFLGGDVDGDKDDGGAGFQFFTFKNMIGFFTIFAWTGIACFRGGLNKSFVIAISLACGLLIMAIMACIFYFLAQLVEDRTMKLTDAISRTGEVCQTIKAKNGGFGKVQISIQGSTHEIQAFTNDEEDLIVGTIVQVEKVIDNHILLVTRKIS